MRGEQVLARVVRHCRMKPSQPATSRVLGMNAEPHLLRQKMGGCAELKDGARGSSTTFSNADDIEVVHPNMRPRQSGAVSLVALKDKLTVPVTNSRPVRKTTNKPLEQEL